MNTEGGLILFFGGMIVIPGVFALVYLINRLAGRKIIPPWILILLLILLPIVGSLYLDFAGEVRSLKLLSKDERIHYGTNFYRTGSWYRRFTVTVQHPWPDTALTPELSISADGKTYDGLRTGQMVDVRVYELSSLIKFGRLANRSTFSLVSDLFPGEPRGPWREGSATVRQVDRFTEQRGRRSSERTPNPWPYQIVRFEFTPPGFDHPIGAMDNIELASLPNLAEGATVSIQWPEDDPRSARIAGATPGAPWANWFYSIAETLAFVAAVLFLLAAWQWFRRRRQNQ